MATGSSTRRSAASVSLALLAFGLAAAPAAAHSGATAGAGCTQEDAPALVLYLPTHAGALAVEVAGVPRAGARRLTLSGLRRDLAMPRDALARANLTRGGESEWLRGTLVLDRVEPGVSVSGEYHFERIDGARLDGRFRARWTTGTANCG